jgi:hypothetical protein
MTTFMKATIQDIRGGRQTWRVMSLLTSSSFVISIATVLARQPF